MKYVVIFVVAVGVLFGVLNYAIGPATPLTQLQLDEEARMRGELTRPLGEDAGLPDTELTAARTVVEREEQASPEVVIVEEPLTPLQLFLDANPDSPLALLDPEEAAKYMPTRENLVEWVESVDAFEDVNAEAVAYDEDTAYLWKLCKEHQALRKFCTDYQTRERARWTDGQGSVALETELQPALGFIRAQFGDDVDVWGAIGAYSEDAIMQIYGEGEEVERRDDEESRWDLVRVLSDAGRPSFDAVGELVRKEP